MADDNTPAVADPSNLENNQHPPTPTDAPDPHAPLAAARLAGYSWPEIHGHIEDSTEAALAAGYTQAEVDAHRGYQDDTGLLGHLWKNTPQEPLQGSPDAPTPIDPALAETYARALQDGTTKDPSTFTSQLALAQGIDPDTQAMIAMQLPHPEVLIDRGIQIAHAIGDAVVSGALAVKDNLLNLYSHGIAFHSQASREAALDPKNDGATLNEDKLLQEALAKPGAIASASDVRAQKEAQKTMPTLQKLQEQATRDAIVNLGPQATELAAGAAVRGPIALVMIAKTLAEAAFDSQKYWDQKLKEAEQTGKMTGTLRDDPGFNATADLVTVGAVLHGVHLSTSILPKALTDLWTDPAHAGAQEVPSFLVQLSDKIREKVSGKAPEPTADGEPAKPSPIAEMAPKEDTVIHLNGVRYERLPEESTEDFLARVDNEREGAIKANVDRVGVHERVDMPDVVAPQVPGITLKAARDNMWEIHRDLTRLTRGRNADNRAMMDVMASQKKEDILNYDRYFKEVEEKPPEEWGEDTKAFYERNKSLFDKQQALRIEKAELLQNPEMIAAAKNQHILKGFVKRVETDEDLTPSSQSETDTITGFRANRTRGLNRGDGLEDTHHLSVEEDAEGNRVWRGDYRDIHPSVRSSVQEAADLAAQVREAVPKKHEQIDAGAQAEKDLSARRVQREQHQERAEQNRQHKAERAAAKSDDELAALKEKHGNERADLLRKQTREGQAQRIAEEKRIDDRAEKQHADADTVLEQAEQHLRETKAKPFGYGDKITRDGKTYTIKPARTEEIEKNTDKKFYHDLMGATGQDVATLQEEVANLKYLQKWGPKLKNSGGWVPDGTKKIPEGWVNVDIPQIRGYAHPKIARPLNEYWQTAMARSRLLQGIAKVNHYITGSMFINPLPHLKNEYGHYFPSRGLLTQWLNPLGFGRSLIYMARAGHSILANDHIFQEYSRISPSELYNASRTRGFNAMQYSKAQQEIAADKSGAWGKLARALNYKNVPDMVGALWGKSNHALWFGSSMLKLARTLEHMDGNPKFIGNLGRGPRISMEEAIAKAHRDMPSYDVGPEVMRSEKLADLLKSQYAMIFGRYRHGQIASIYNLVRDAVGTDRSISERAEAVDKMLSFAVMYHAMAVGVLGGFAGGMTLVHHAVQAWQDSDKWSSLSNSVATLNPVVDYANMIRNNVDHYSKTIWERKGDAIENVSRVAKTAINQIPIAKMAGDLIKDPMKFLKQQLTFADPPKAVDPKQQAKWDARDRAKALKDESKDDVVQWIRNMIGEPQDPVPVGRGAGDRSGGGGGGGNYIPRETLQERDQRQGISGGYGSRPQRRSNFGPSVARSPGAPARQVGGVDYTNAGGETQQQRDQRQGIIGGYRTTYNPNRNNLARNYRSPSRRRYG